MANLFVIGNGFDFDFAHAIKTNYEDFHQYLIRKYKINSEVNNIVPGI